jgi:hypothetical protein
MKKLIPLVQYSIAAALWLSPVTARAHLVAPRVPPREGSALAHSAAAQPAKHKPAPSVKTVTSAKDSGPGSLRQAIATAAPGDSIVFHLKLPATIALSSTLVITQDVAVLGPGPDWLTVMRSGASNTPLFRVFDVENGGVTLAGITIGNGIAFDASTFFDNLGGGIFSRGMLTVSNCLITGNMAPTSGPATNQSIGFGAGIFATEGSLTIINSTIAGNQSSAAGGGVCTFETSTFLAMGSTISGNSAGIQGGGINYQGHIGTIQNCTIAGNTTPEDAVGSGIADVVFAAEAPTLLTLTACTVAYNTGGTNGAITVVGLNSGAGLTNRLLSTLVADNTPPNFGFQGTVTFQSLGHNLDSDGSSGMVNGVNGDIVGSSASPIDAKLGPLQDNGGPTDTIALLVGSPALGTGSCTDANGAPLLIDQRGFPRGPNPGCDIGAYENQPLTLTCPVPIVVGFQDETGALVTFSATVTDLCPQVTTVYQPPSGSLFPIGVTPVLVEAVDGCSSNSAQCSFTVTVLGAQSVKSNVLASLEALRAGATDHKDQQGLDAAIADLMDSLAPALWIDQTHPNLTKGAMEFAYEQDAVHELQKIIKDKHSKIPDATAQDLINQLVNCDRALAVVSIQDAEARGADPKKIDKAQKEVANGDKEAAKGNSEQAIDHYSKAWSQAVRL